MLKIAGSVELGKTRWSGVHASWPFGSVTVSREAVTVCALMRSITIRRDQLAEITLRRRLFARAFIFRLHDPAALKHIVFIGLWNTQRVQAALESTGWSVTVRKG